jgi:hypothetical protein
MSVKIMSNTDIERRVNKLELKVQAMERMPKKTCRSELSKLKAELEKPVNWTPKDKKDIISIAGIFEGPEDLSQHFRSYLYEERK